MDPLITNGVDPAMLRNVDKRGHERDAEQRRRRPAAPGKTPREEDKLEPSEDTPKHTLDDLA
jgi:hypothetical protein